MRKRKILVADLLCGAGGSSTGCERALRDLGLEMELVCVNHWGVALETHRKNHPNARFFCQDIAAVRPIEVVPEGYLDLLMASPTCTHHSVARGGKPTSDQQRSDPWHIITWLTELRVKRIIIENVWEFIGWGPVDPRTGKPIKSQKGVYFNTWISAIRGLGFEPEWRKLNAADYGDATTRQRFILMARNDRRQVHWPVATHTKAQDGKLLFPGMKTWRPARDIIDWSLKGRSILTRPIPLAPKTLARILAGALKFGWPQPFITLLLGAIERSLRYYLGQAFKKRNIKGKLRQKRRALVVDYLARLRHFKLAPMEFAKGGRSTEAMLITLRKNAHGRSLSLPIPALAANGRHVGLAQPIIVSPRHGKEGAGPRPREVDQPIPTITAGGSQMAVAEPVIVKQNFRRDVQSVEDPAPTIMTQARLGLAEPVIINGRRNNHAKGVSTDPVPTLDTKGGVWVVEPFVMATGDGAPRSTDEPMPTITTGGAGSDDPGCARPMLVEPFILNRASDGHGDTRAHSVEEPAPTATTSGAGYVVEPVVVNLKGQSTATDVDQPLPTQTAHAGHLYVAEPFLCGNRTNNTPKSVDEPVGTATTTTGGGHFLVTVAHGNDAGESSPNERRAHSVEDPLGTIHAGGGKYAVVEPFVLSQHAGGAPRGIDEPTPTQVAKHSHVLISPYYGSGSGETCKSAEQPLDTVTSKSRFGMVVPVTHSQGGNVARDIDEPLPTMTTAKGGEFAMVMPVTHADHSDRVRDPSEDPLPTVTGANRGELAFIAAQFGERDGQAPRVHDVNQPTPAICATGHVNLVEGTEQYDILFRMLEPHELAAAMGFNTEEAEYEFAGTKTEKIKQIGNAVSVAKMKACVSAIMADAAVTEQPTARQRTAAAV